MALLDRVLQRGPLRPAPLAEQQMSVIEHLEALRRALIVIIIAWAITTIAAFFVSGQIVGWLVTRTGAGHGIYLNPAGGVLTEIKVALYIGLVLAAALSALPLYLNVLNRLSPPNVNYLPDIGELVGFILTMVIGFGLVFELPVILFVLGMMRIISSRWLYKNRPWWFLGLGLLSNFLTPGADPLTPLIMFVPLYFFYESTALILKLSK